MSLDDPAEDEPQHDQDHEHQKDCVEHVAYLLEWYRDDPGFLEPYHHGRVNFDAAITSAGPHVGDAADRALLQRQVNIARQWQVDKRFIPAMKAPDRKRIAAGWERALGRAKAWEQAATDCAVPAT